MTEKAAAIEVPEQTEAKRSEVQIWVDEVIDLLDERFGTGGYEERREEQREILKRCYLNNFREAVEEAVERQEEWQQLHDEGPLLGEEREKTVRGHVFEQLAIASLPEESRSHPELEEFILSALKDPRLWSVAFEGDLNESFTEEEKGLALEYLTVKPTQDELYAMRNNDAIAVEIVEGEGGPVALITGVKEAKNYRLGPQGQAAKQAAQAPEKLVEVVRRFKKVFPLLVRYLGLSGELPEQIDIVNVEDLDYTIIQPRGVKLPSQKVRREVYPNCTFERIPFSQKEVAVIAGTILPEADFTRR